MDRQYAREIGWGRYLWRTFVYKFMTALCRRDASLRLPTGLRMHLPRTSPHAAEIFGTGGLVDWGAELLLAEYLRAGGAREPQDFYDVGANIGLYSMLLAPVVHAVHAFEPDPRNLGPLRLNAARSGRINVVGNAVAATSETRWFDVSGGMECNHLVAGQDAPARAEGLLRVETTTLDAYRGAHPGPRVAAVKMDVEGYECEALDGAHALTSQERPVFLIEFFLGPPHVNTLARLGGFLARHDYRIYAVVRSADFARTRRAELRQPPLEEVPATRTKMLFLAPAAERFFADRLGPLAEVSQG